MPLASAFTPTCNISSAPAPLSRKNSLSQHFFIQKSKTCHETLEFTSQTEQNTKNDSWATMPLGSAFRPTCNISSALAPLARKNSLSQHFFIQRSKTCHETVEFTSQWGAKHQKLLLGNNAPGKCLHAHMQHFFSPSTAVEKKFIESAFFHTKIKNLSRNRRIYEPNGTKRQKLLRGNNAPGKCLQAHMQHFFSPSPAIEKKFGESAFFHTKIKNLSWNRWIYEPMGANTKNYSLATMPLASAFTPTCNISSALAPLSRKNSPSQHFFIKNQKLVMKPLNLRANGGQNTKNYSLATMPLASAFPPTCNISSALAPLSRKNSSSQHFFIQKSKTCHETVEFTSQTEQNTKTTPGQQCPWQVPSRSHATFLQP